MGERPYVVLSCAMSVDGCLDAPGPQRLVLSGPADQDRVDGERAAADAILVGAGTIRRDDPRLLVRSPERRGARVARGLPEHPARVTLTASGDLDPRARFFAPAPAAAPPAPAPPAAASPASTPPALSPLPLLYCPPRLAPDLRARVNGLAQVVGLGEPIGLRAVLADLAARGVGRLLVEGGARLAAEFLTSGLVDELQLAVAPFFVGDAAAPRFAAPGRYPHGPGQPMALVETARLDGVVLLRYLLGGGAPGRSDEPNDADRRWLREAIELSRRCPPSATAFAVGAVLVAQDGQVLATGYSREADPVSHAEEAALAKCDPADARLASATLYSSLEPCASRASRPRPCADLIIAAGVRRVVMAWREPPRFAPGGGAEVLREAGITVAEARDLAAAARAVNAAVLPG